MNACQLSVQHYPLYSYEFYRFVWYAFLKPEKTPQQTDNNYTPNRNDFYQTFFPCCNLLAIGFSVFTIHMMIKRLLKSSSCNFINSYTTNIRERENIPWKQQSNDKIKIQQDKLKHITKKTSTCSPCSVFGICVCVLYVRALDNKEYKKEVNRWQKYREWTEKNRFIPAYEVYLLVVV